MRWSVLVLLLGLAGCGSEPACPAEHSIHAPCAADSCAYDDGTTCTCGGGELTSCVTCADTQSCTPGTGCTYWDWERDCDCGCTSDGTWSCTPFYQNYGCPFGTTHSCPTGPQLGASCIGDACNYADGPACTCDAGVLTACSTCGDPSAPCTPAATCSYSDLARDCNCTCATDGTWSCTPLDPNDTCPF